jgi:hypothetical protein
MIVAGLAGFLAVAFAAFGARELSSELADSQDTAANVSECIVGAEADMRVVYARIRHAPKSAAEVERVQELLQIMARGDQDARRILIETVTTCSVSFEDAAMRKLIKVAGRIDRLNQIRLKRLIKKVGWPLKSVYGADAAAAAALIVQHADRDPAFQEYVLGVFKPLRETAEIEGESYALLYDRVQEAKGEKQRYGTQGDCDGTRFKIDPVEDEISLDELRGQVGLPPIDDYIRTTSELLCQ